MRQSQIDKQVGFIGAGRMAQAMASGLVRGGRLESSQIWAFDPADEAKDRFTSAIEGSQFAESNQQVAQKSEVVILAIKPQNFSAVAKEMTSTLTREHLVVSIMAGIRLARLRKELGDGPRLIRVMPNTPCLVGSGASGFSRGAGATDSDAQLVAELLETVGVAVELEEKLLDAVTGLSGSGPALVYVMIEALSDGGVRMGLPREVATRLAAQTVAGAAEMVLSTGEHPARLKDQVASPGGTTIAALETLESGSVRAALIAAVRAATLRSEELGSEELGTS